MKRSWMACVASLILVAGSTAGCADRPRVVEYEPGRFYFDWDQRDKTSRAARVEFHRSFERRVELLAQKLREPIVINALKRHGGANRDTPLEAILERDLRWQLGEDDQIVEELTDAACGETLRNFMAAFEGFKEILVTDMRGINVCVTGRTTDYYQGDEDWWQDTARSDKPLNGRLSYDESADAVGVPAYLPVLDPTRGTRLGVAKAVIRHDMGKSGQSRAPAS